MLLSGNQRGTGTAPVLFGTHETKGKAVGFKLEMNILQSQVVLAWQLLIAAGEGLRGVRTFSFDLVDVGRQVSISTVFLRER